MQRVDLIRRLVDASELIRRLQEMRTKADQLGGILGADLLDRIDGLIADCKFIKENREMGKKRNWYVMGSIGRAPISAVVHGCESEKGAIEEANRLFFLECPTDNLPAGMCHLQGLGVQLHPSEIEGGVFWSAVRHPNRNLAEVWAAHKDACWRDPDPKFPAPPKRTVQDALGASEEGSKEPAAGVGIEEALGWLRGERSCWSDRTWLAQESNRAAVLAESAREDVAQTERAYWIVRAHREGLLGKGGSK